MSSTYAHARVPIAWVMDPRIGRDDIAVLTVLLCCTDGRTGNVKVRQGRVGELLSKSRTWVNAVFKRLEEFDILAVIASPTGRSQTYRVLLPTKPDKPKQTTYPAPTDEQDNPVNESDTGCQSADTILSESSKDSLSTQECDSFDQDWEPKEETQQAAKSFYPTTDLKSHLRHFVSKILERGYRYSNFDQAWLDWLKTDARHFPLDPPAGKERKYAGRRKQPADNKPSIFRKLYARQQSGPGGQDGMGSNPETGSSTGNGAPLLAAMSALIGGSG